MNDQFIQFAYLAAAVLLIRGLSGLGSPKTAPIKRISTMTRCAGTWST